MNKSVSQRFTNARFAGVSIETLLMIVLALAVLFLSLGVFDDNLSEMGKAGGFNNIVNKPHKPQYSDTSVDYTTSQVNVKIAGSQGLTTVIPKYKATAEEEITNLSNAFAQNGSLTLQQQYDLAKWLTIYGVCSQTNGTTSLSAAYYYVSGNPRLAALAGSNGLYPITVDLAGKRTTLSDKTKTITIPINWGSNSQKSEAHAKNTVESTIQLVTDINNMSDFNVP